MKPNKNNKPNVFDKDKPENADGSSVTVSEVPTTNEAVIDARNAVQTLSNAIEAEAEVQPDDSKTTLQQLQERKAELETAINAYTDLIKSGKMSFAQAMSKATLQQAELDSIERDISKDTLRGDVVKRIMSALDVAKYHPNLILIKIEKTEDGKHITTHFDSEVQEALKAKSSATGTGRSSAIWVHNEAKTEHKPLELFATVRDNKAVTDTMRNKADKYRQWELLLADLHKAGLLLEYSHKR